LHHHLGVNLGKSTEGETKQNRSNVKVEKKDEMMKTKAFIMVMALASIL